MLPNLLQPRNLQRLQDQRDLTVLMDGSPNYFHTFGAIAATANEYVNMETTFPQSRGYAPLEELVLTNRSGEFLDLEVNGRAYGRIPAGVIWTLTSQAIWTFRINNNDITNVAAGEITANISTPPMGADKMARMTYARSLRRRPA